MPDSFSHCVKVHVIEAGLDTVFLYLPQTSVYAHSILKPLENFEKF